MKLLKEFSSVSDHRLIWVSEQARQNWETALFEVGQMVQDLEIDSVAAGHRKCAWRSIDESTLPEFTDKCAEKGLLVYPVKRTGKFDGFAHRTPQLVQGQPANVYTIIARKIRDAKTFADAHHSGDNQIQGQMLGFPKCCVDFFDKYWAKGFIDPIWQWAKEKEEVESHPYSNPVLRYINLRVGFHIPCSPNCEPTIKLSEERLSIADPDKVKLLEALLSMPMQWDCYRGIAVIKTPLFYIVTNSTPSIDKFIVNIKGGFIPRQGGRGINFPFNTKV